MSKQMYLNNILGIVSAGAISLYCYLVYENIQSSNKLIRTQNRHILTQNKLMVTQNSYILTQNKLIVTQNTMYRPSLTTITNITTDEVSIILLNAGIGPAKINSIKIGDQEISKLFKTDEITKLCDTPLKTFHRTNFSLGSGQSITLFKCTPKEEYEKCTEH